ncbi:MAG: helix-turn-helix domain-containing protein [Candidatus Nanopelagicales bacterium]|nr:helix-turn-helix domain-containing protein [Candidatus Nanopelagicales bacterium]MDP4906669.1 helix-turn-helix domain-containing protein [Candidatus Nanopelagicales bacterium]MDP4974795.1 helix-turn-helix domain-containing protein [Candidatus Nanopelagicales bacterium]MDP5095761.1 helix-turn-helix domain-containing protein [Candidatus Nanopelagicales bacterium]
MSAVAFRNVVATPSDPVDSWPFEALVETLERGLVPDWQPVLADIRRHPWGRVARRVGRWAAMLEGDPAARLFTLAIERARQRRETDERDEVAHEIRDAIAGSGMTAAEFAASVGTSASRLSTYATGRVVPSATMLVRIRRARD